MKRFGCLLVVLMFAAACSDDPPVPGPGPMTVTLKSPNPSEGAAVVRVTGPGINSVSGGTGFDVFSEIVGQTATVVVIAEQPGELSFSMAVDDTTAAFSGEVVQVSSPVDLLRSGVADYRLEVRR